MAKLEINKEDVHDRRNVVKKSNPIGKRTKTINIIIIVVIYLY